MYLLFRKIWNLKLVKKLMKKWIRIKSDSHLLFVLHMLIVLMTRTERRRNTAHPTRDGKHNPVCIDPNCKDCA